MCLCLIKKLLLPLLIHSPSFLCHSLLTCTCTCQGCCPKIAPPPSSWTEAGWLSVHSWISSTSFAWLLRQSVMQCPLPRGQASSSSVRRNDPSVCHAKNPESPHVGVWVQIPPPGGRAETPANDCEMQRVSALVSWSTEALHQLELYIFPQDGRLFLPSLNPLIQINIMQKMNQE